MNQTLSVVALVIGSLLFAACQRKGPEPKENTAAAPEAPAPAADPHAGLGLTPEQQEAVDKIPRPEPDASGKIDLGAMTVQVPEGWQFVKARALMRRAQFLVPSPKGDAEMIVFFMGTAGAGSVNANVERWIGQFTQPDGTRVVDVKPEEKKVAGFDVTQLEVAGDYSGMLPQGDPDVTETDQRLLAAIVSTPQGPYYIKLLGPDTVVAKNKAAFEGMLASMKPTAKKPPTKPTD
ncbi:MAG: hypothetical protein WBG86_17200 [Polyangiales bacterium]